MMNFNDAARAAGSEIIDVLDNDKPGCFHEIITKHFQPLAELNAKLIQLAIAVKNHEDNHCAWCDHIGVLLSDPTVAAAIRDGDKGSMDA